MEWMERRCDGGWSGWVGWLLKSVAGRVARAVRLAGGPGRARAGQWDEGSADWLAGLTWWAGHVGRSWPPRTRDGRRGNVVPQTPPGRRLWKNTIWKEGSWCSISGARHWPWPAGYLLYFGAQ